ncbi:hypothetical protein [Flagellimonas meishanensis]|uniref:hypothetical protein n=1 Tax=Flagellimonas meishanensis TaxID=2873264 RepID=UPI001CA79359|nr:hypothetical protein [[Muricauda] meishanensis]
MRNCYIYFIVGIVSLLGEYTYSQSLTWDVSSCEELDLRPVESVANVDILGSFYEIEDPDQRGCWVHHHPNGADFVVTPKIWGRVPNDARIKQIYEAMEALTTAREAYGKYGDLSTNLYYILDDVSRSLLGEAFWIVNNSCWMVSGVPNVSPLSAQHRLQIYTHEIGHCLIMENMNNFSRSYDLNNWFDESVAEYLSAQAYPTAEYEHGWSVEFQFSEPFRQRYSAYPLWQKYVEKEGDGMLFPMMQSLVNAQTLAERRNIMRSTGFDAILHDFYFDFFRHKILDTGSNVPIPVNTTTLKSVTIKLDPDSRRLGIEPMPMDKLNGYNLVIPPGYDLDINPMTGPADGLHQSLMQGTDYHIANWNTKKTIKGDCENDVSFLVLSSHLNNKPLTNLYFDYALRKKEESDCCDETILGDCDKCLAPVDEESAMSPNPVDKIDGVFKFDYKIEALVKFHMDMSDVNTEYARGNPNELIMEYYVNSADGSILFPGGPTGFFSTNLRGDMSKVDASIWLANGQMVTYGYDANNRQKRAATRKINQTADQRMGSDYLNMMQFFRSSAELAEHPDPMPAHIKWNNITQGYKGKMIEGHTGIENTWTLYFDTEPTPIKTTCTMMGYMVGVLKDVREQNCNRLIVYNRVDIGGEGSGEAIEAELRAIRPMGMNFDATDYKPMYLGGERGTDINTKMKNFEARMKLLLQEKESLKERRRRCPLDVCRDRIDAQLESIDEDIKRLNCEIARTVGMEDMLDDCN